MPGQGRSKIVAALGLSILMVGCDGSVRTPLSPSAPTPAPPLAPAPAPPPVTSNNVLSGVVFQSTAAGPTPIEGATVYLLSCGVFNCPRSATVDYAVKTDKDGGYRMERVYSGTLNFLWVSDEVYAMAEPMAPGTCPDRCDRVVTVNGDTRLDLELRRR